MQGYWKNHFCDYLCDPTQHSLQMLLHLATLALLAAFMLLYLAIARRFSITDIPNGRSSHTRVTVRGAGILFPLALLAHSLHSGSLQMLPLIALTGIAFISFMDDLFTVRQEIRIIIHLLALTVLLCSCGACSLPWFLLIPGVIMATGYVNAFNFMDGINGISVLTFGVTLVSTMVLNSIYNLFPTDMLTITALSSVVFAWFNLRKNAVCFPGDVGSISLGFISVWLVAALISRTGRVDFILFGMVYFTDTLFSIVFRLRRGEYIFTPHRTHLYQLLANEKGWPHIAVSAVFAGIQLLINGLVIAVVLKPEISIYFYAIPVAALPVLYPAVRRYAVKP